jgi:hypothetical protein
MLIQKGTRQPQTKNWSPDMVLKISTATLAKNSPAGPPHCGQDVINPRWEFVLAHSIAINVAPPHSPPIPMPWMKRTTVRITAPQIPIVS